MKDTDIIENINQSLISAKASLDAVSKWTELLAEKNGVELNNSRKKAEKLTPLSSEADEQIIEGVFDGQNMVAPDGTIYPVPANYASKSKLVQGDVLKLTIMENGAFVFKQIQLVPRRMVTGKLILEGSQYKALCEDRTYSVLYASVTFFKGNVGDDIAIILPEGEDDVQWAAVENVLPVKVK